MRERIQAVSNWHREWLTEAGPEVLRGAEADVRRYVSEGDLPAVRASTIPLGSLATFFGIRGAAKLADGNGAAWDDIFLSAAFRLEFLRLRFALWTKVGSEPGLDFEVPKIGTALCFCLANGFTHWAQFLTDVLTRASGDDEIVSNAYWTERVFEPFALRLSQYALTDGSVPPPAIDSLGVYSDVFDEWASPDRLLNAIAAICDYHCENMYYDDDDHENGDEDEDDWDYEFDDPPCDLVAWEVLAIREVRARMGLVTLLPEHPLLVPLRTFVARKELPFDERLNAIEELARRQYMTVELP